MFKHGKTGKEYFSIRDKIKYYNKRAFNDENITPEQKAYALKRLEELKALDKRLYDEPIVVVSDDKHFGNGMSKPRACIAIKTDSKNRILVAPIEKVTSNYVIFDNNIDRQISKTAEGKNKWLDKSDIYEEKYIYPSLELTDRDKAKIRRLYK